MRLTELAMLIRSSPSFMGLNRMYRINRMGRTRKTTSWLHPAHPVYPVRFAVRSTPPSFTNLAVLAVLSFRQRKPLIFRKTAKAANTAKAYWD
jgi:hypothetical protein